MQAQAGEWVLGHVGVSVWQYDLEQDTFWCRGPAAGSLGAAQGYAPAFSRQRNGAMARGPLLRLLACVRAAPQRICCTEIRTRTGERFRLRCRGVWRQGKLCAIAGICSACEETESLLPQVPLQGTEAFIRRLGALLPGKGGSVLQLLVRDFGAVNDGYGYQMGDALLEQVGVFLSGVLGDEAAYAGGGRFWMYLAPPIAQPSVRRRLDPLLARFSRAWVVGAQRFYIRAEVGVAASNGVSCDARRLLARAELAAEEADKCGGIGFFAHPMHLRAHRRVETEHALRTALEQGRFVLFYQPQVAPQSGRIVGMEALLRWVSPEHTCILPPDFIPVAEGTGLIRVIGEWTLETACRQMRLWHGRTGAPDAVAVNLSPVQFAQDGLPETVARVLRETGLDPAALELEITEKAVAEDIERAADTLQKLRAMGVRVALDDFGTGYSSLSYLRRLPIQKLKIDRSFVTGITRRGKERVIAGSIIRLAHDLLLTVVAEGVENEEQRRILCGQGCDSIQGFLYSRPVPAERMQRLFAGGVGHARAAWFPEK